MRSCRHCSARCSNGSACRLSDPSEPRTRRKIATCSSASDDAWTSTFVLVVLLTLSALAVSGCARTVLVSEDSPIRTGPDLHARVYTLTSDGDWRLSDNKVHIPEGWYCVPPSFVKDK